ncbi:mismatch repair endonuclease PMS2 [Trichonephila inaurata madagascariensis]|uniref:Mismatch repair endonuclease PMS2 n=1 Tax=Trichonephila inaurata madagascariensis TaxID=2747483 RepID=A0A8X7CI78_9ARAC|nr:mismatch repair endonuclease PMS2 [Trichonephila inaurata madagascariensis]
MATGSIKPIDRTSVHKICSGQVVLTLAIAVKELVENSIDAGATTIEVKLEEHGSKSVEVIDNGKGVKACDFESLTLKHHTSKIADFSDVSFVSTFGFRGEALSSLCALSDLEIKTRHAGSNVGTILSFDHNGILIESSPTARQVGTTVSLKNIFSTLPVRRKEFLRHLRKEYLKMIQLLTAYCLISVNKCIMCYNTSDKGKKTLVLSTSNCQTFEDTIASVFGNKQMNQIMKIIPHPPSKEILDEYFLPETAAEISEVFKLEGYISNSNHGEGRSSTDRQFYFINGRPCDLPKVSRLINEVYHTFNKNQYPFVFLNIILNVGCADVNVTPDKRQIFIPDEKVLLAFIKATLYNMYIRQPAQMNISVLNFATQKKESSILNSSTSEKEELNDSSLKRKFEGANSHCDSEESPTASRVKNQKLDDSMDDIIKIKASDSPVQNNSFVLTESSNTIKEQFIEKSQSGAELSHYSDKLIQSTQNVRNRIESINFTLTLPLNEEKMFKSDSQRKSGSSKLSEILDMARFGCKSSKKMCTMNSYTSIGEPPSKSTSKSTQNNKIFNFLKKCSYSNTINKSEIQVQEILLEENDGETDKNNAEETDKELESTEEVLEPSFDEPLQRKRNYKVIPFSMEMVKNKLLIKDEEINSEECGFRKFRSKIDPSENQNAEEELKKEISKEDFSSMKIIGQFNLGFILTRLNDDLFIIDQHATDEKYNFEQLQKETVLETQLLLQPQDLNLTAVTETILIDSLHVFEMNGFKFKINEEKPSGQRVQLVSVPVSRNWSFGKEDVDELIFMLTDHPIRMVRPSRVNQMFASRACRKSVMIGTALTTPMMKKLVTHMGEIEQPWNCPHGRPTIRHLFNLKLLKTV